MKRAFLFLILAAVISGGIFYFCSLEKDVYVETEEVFVFNEDYLKNTTIEIYCLISFKDGSFFTEDLSLFCDNKNLPETSFQAEIEKIEIKEDGLLLISSQIKDYPKRYDLVAISPMNKTTKHTLSSKPNKIEWEEELITVHFEDKSIFYRVVGDVFQETVKEKYRYASADFGFSVEIPRNWLIEKREDDLIFYHPDALYTYPIILKKEKPLVFYTTENTPYQKTYQEMIDSLRVNEIDTLSDYTFLKKDLQEYLEINTKSKDINYYQNKEVVDQFEVLNMVDKQYWGGVPTGLYEVLSKEGLRFSTTSSVYMPFSVRFYGKYLVHGEPYYPSGAPYTAAVSGGCIRVKNERMKSLYEILEGDTPILIIPGKNEKFHLTEKRMIAFPEISAESFLVADLDSGKVFVDRTPYQQKAVGSIAKMMTAIVAVEHFSTTHPLTVRDYMLVDYQTTSGIYAGRTFRLVDLLLPLLVQSSDSAAAVVAHFLGRDDTLIRMNEKTERIGMMNTKFTTPTGREEENISTAEDLYYLAYYLVNSRIPLLNISRGAWTTDVNYGIFPNLKNDNLFYADPQFIGGKSGFASKETGFYIFNLNLGEEKRTVVFIVLGSDNTQKDIQGLRGWLEDSYRH